MAALTIDNPTPTLLIQLGDVLTGDGQAAAAEACYRQALAIAPPDMHMRIIPRIGIAARPNIEMKELLETLQRLERTFKDSNPFVSTGMATWGKTLSFLDDQRFMALADKHQTLLPLPNWHWNLNAALWAVWQARDVAGDFVELGVFKGHTTLFLAEYLEFQNHPRRWVLYDTFEGIPADQLNHGWAEVNERVYAGTYSFEEVRDRFAAFPNIEVIQGRVPAILDGTAPERIAFIHLDLNSATAEIAALDRLYDRLSPGGVILLDDYGWQVAQEQHRAEREWFARKGLRILELPTGQGVFVKGA